MKKEDLLSDDFLKQFLTGEDLYGFLTRNRRFTIRAYKKHQIKSNIN